jgi:polysaccharide biosynthesis protein VpsQ
MRSFRILAVLFAAALLVIIASAELGLAQVWFGSLYNFPYGDAVGHLLLLGGLSFLTNLGFPSGRLIRPPLLKTCLVIAGLVTLEELSQLFLPNRTFSFIDLGANYAGIFAFGEIAAALHRRWSTAKPPSVPSQGRL